MEAKSFTGLCNCKSSYNGNPVGKDFDTEQVEFNQLSFIATMDKHYVQIGYAAENLKPGEYDLDFTPAGATTLQYHNGKTLLRLTGTGKVTIGPNLDTQKGTIDASYLDDIGRPITFKGTFSANYELK
ncbi:hypothetical protein JFT81_16875 [Pseudomonas sp. TH43]|uniref:hypothetical protein n=1 Tax=Pseudomonas sp. TH43 TaxID=2796407 RepID=UPI0019114640|nr:hypothetical protein [Pseudomonas sp. TH43]MBK5376303.1 hypothetical protein [Pseudomonas sp. TH43]